METAGTGTGNVKEEKRRQITMLLMVNLVVIVGMGAQEVLVEGEGEVDRYKFYGW